ncbi:MULTISPECIES: NAD(P)H-binding protein [Mesotoga]|uniref:Putative NADH-flavin reductase n=1 Tax=Mesotoga prima MesG1.Ag.4.2 TaxID=660470 RepID=I2F6B9_9BACT|nr:MULTISPECIES: NAD(P)H-binding protein [Mesotoga]MCP5457623.1 NAD(P)H-binding protein [Thermotogota bacterium]CCU84665.1 NAD-dependent epimerase/dehydratase [Mesotoga infera]AFK07472.1 putative NADH-flavin reductase [Mesotoga prima MesG1.Ag.4.2]MDK2944145.1 uncharacterized protein [Mesotoga sp.]HNQ71191.1 NAD(P)H-binding protein [Mesotoga prima]
MKIIIFGGTGRVGRVILDRALGENHIVTVFVGDVSKLTVRKENLRIFQGDVFNSQSVRDAIRGQDAIISALGPDNSGSVNDTLAVAMKNIVSGARETEVNKIVTIANSGILQLSPRELRLDSPNYPQYLKKSSREFLDAFEILKTSELDWVVVCPPFMTFSEGNQSYRVSADFLPENGVKISVQDVAEFAFKQLFTSEYSQKRVGIAY